MMGIKTLLLICLFVAPETFFVTARNPDSILVGAPVNINTDDSEVHKVLQIAAASYNEKSNDAFLFKPSAVESAQQQVVEGMKYTIDFEMSRTVCRNQGIGKNLYSCAFQPEGPMQQTLGCYVEVWVVPWEKVTKIEILHCKYEPSR